MRRAMRRWRWWLIGAVVLFVITAGAWLGRRSYWPSPGSIEEAFFRVHTGVWVGDAVEALQAYSGSVDYTMVTGVTKDGHSFSDLWFDRLPLPSEIDRCELQLGTEDGETIVIDIGTGGRVTDKHFSSDSWWSDWFVNLQKLLGR